MKLTAYPSRDLRGRVQLPGDKSISHRAALLGALASGQSRFQNFLDAGVTRVMLNLLTQLGVKWELAGTDLTVNGTGLAGLQPTPEPLLCGNSATTLRLLAGAIAAAGLPAVLDGSTGLRLRPMERLIQPLSQLGVPIASASSGTAPLTMHARSRQTKLKSRKIELKIASAQVKSAVLLAALDAIGPVSVVEPAPSRDHTERMLTAMGAEISTTEAGITLIPSASRLLSPLTLTIPGDFSSAAFIMVAALITPGSRITIERVGLNPGRIGLLETLMEMGAQISILDLQEASPEPFGTLQVEFSELNGMTIAGGTIVKMIDELPVLAVAAAFATGTTRVQNAEELRFKETDRIRTLVQTLSQVGVDISEQTDGFTILGGATPRGGTVSGYGDHRLAMSLAVLGLGSRDGVTLEDAEVIGESFPGFSDCLQNLGATLIATHA